LLDKASGGSEIAVRAASMLGCRRW